MLSVKQGAMVFEPVKSFWLQCDTMHQVYLAQVSKHMASLPYRGESMVRQGHKSALAKKTLSQTHPELAAEWHPTKNGNLTPSEVVAGSHIKVWWRCPLSPDHEWPATVKSRTKQGSGCPCCAGQTVSVTNSLASLFPDIAAQWHQTKNIGQTPDMMVAGSGVKVWWKCPKGPDHEWQATLASRTQANPTGCPYCAGKKVSVTNCLALLFPEVAVQWHPIKNGDLKPETVVAGSGLKVWWTCPKGPDHEWQATVASQTQANPTGCPCCAGKKVSVTNSLDTQFPQVAEQWHPTKNGDVTPDQVVAGSHKKFWWQCPHGPDHEWPATVKNRTKQGYGCPCCAGQKVSVTNSLASRFPDIAAEWHSKGNGSLSPDKVVAGSNKPCWWKCTEAPDHEWQATPNERVSGRGCPHCAGKRVSVTNSLTARFPAVAAEWHPTKNGNLTPEMVVSGAGFKVWWKCPNGSHHEWQATLNHRTHAVNPQGCPYCNRGWTLEAIRAFVASLREHLPTFTAAELYLLFQQNGLLTSIGKGKTFVKALITGRFPKEEIEKFVNGEPSLVDEFVQDPTQTLEALNAAEEELSTEDKPIERADELVNVVAKEGEQELPVIETKDVLGSLALHVISSADEEAVEFLLASAIAKIWKHAYSDEEAAVAQANTASVDG